MQTLAGADRQAPISPAQAYHWALSRRAGASADIVIVLAVLARGAPDEAALRRAVGALALRHVSLRSRFAGPDRVAISLTAPVALEVLDHAAAGRFQGPASVATAYEAWYGERGLGDGAGRAVAAVVDAHKAHLYDIETELPLRASLVRHGEAASTVVLGVHHAAVDAHSLSLLARDLERFVRDPSTAPDERYLAHAADQAHRLAARGEQEEAYWAGLLSDPRRLRDESILERPSRTCALHTQSIPMANDGAAGAGVGRRFVQAPYMVAFAQALEHLGRLSSTHILTTTGNRGPEEQDIVGCFYRHLIWRAPEAIGADADRAVTALAVQSLRSYQNLTLTLDRIIAACRRVHGGAPALDACLNFRDLRPVQSAGRDTGRFEPVPFYSGVLQERLPVHLHVSRELDRMSAALVYDPDWLTADEASNLLGHFVGRLDTDRGAS